MDGKNIRIVLVDKMKLVKDIREVPYTFTKKGYLNKNISSAIIHALKVADHDDTVILHLVKQKG